MCFCTLSCLSSLRHSDTLLYETIKQCGRQPHWYKCVVRKYDPEYIKFGFIMEGNGAEMNAQWWTSVFLILFVMFFGHSFWKVIFGFFHNQRAFKTLEVETVHGWWSSVIYHGNGNWVFYFIYVLVCFILFKIIMHTPMQCSDLKLL